MTMLRKVFLMMRGLVIAAGVVAATGLAAAPPDERALLERSILEYVAERNPAAPRHLFASLPAVVLAESSRAGVDHCLVLAWAQAESDFRHDAVGAAGEIGLFQILPSTAAILEPVVGSFRRPVVARRAYRDLGDLADPVVSTRFALAYLRDILGRKPNLRDALTEYNGGPRGRAPHYYRTVMATYVEVLEQPRLQCRLTRGTPRVPVRAPRPPVVTAAL
jgi:soluble lytic murein transglycosylase-like protein